MTAYVEECRQEWRRLGVPELLAEEMATELESDLAEAQADGVSATEILGESDPRRFAATWASERGLVSERPRPKRNRKRLWFALAVVLVLGFVLGVLALVSLATTGVHTSGRTPCAGAGARRDAGIPSSCRHEGQRPRSGGHSGRGALGGRRDRAGTGCRRAG